MLEYVNQIKDLTESERLLFGNELKDKSKSVWIGQLTCLFLGFLGTHRFYLNQNKEGLFYFVGIPALLFISASLDWTPVAALIMVFYTLGLLVETLMMRERVKTFNSDLATELSQKIKDLREK